MSRAELCGSMWTRRIRCKRLCKAVPTFRSISTPSTNSMSGCHEEFRYSSTDMSGNVGAVAMSTF
jgi:hypothetical protein